MNDKTKLTLEDFFPVDSLQITEVKEERSLLRIHMRSVGSVTKTCKCPVCQQVSSKYHGTYTRKVQDFPSWGNRSGSRSLHMNIIVKILPAIS